MSRRPFIAGNWKMNRTPDDAQALASSIRKALEGFDKADVALCPPFVCLAAVAGAIQGSTLLLGAQNVYWEKSGAFTGEISAPMLRAIFAIKNGLRRDRGVPSTVAMAPEVSYTDSRAMLDCDMERADEYPLWISRRLFGWMSRQRIVERRRENYRAYADALSRAPGVRALHPTLPEAAAPYAFAVLVDDAERVYHALRSQGMPVYRWDRVWPRTPAPLSTARFPISGSRSPSATPTTAR